MLLRVCHADDPSPNITKEVGERSMSTMLASQAQRARMAFERSKKTREDWANYLGEVAALAFDLWVEAYNHKLPRGAQKYVITVPTRLAIQLMGEAYSMHLSCPVNEDHHHEDFATAVWRRAEAHGHQELERVRALAKLLGLA